MTIETAQDAMTALDRLLEREREALIGGDLDFLVGLFEEKKRLIDKVNDQAEASEPDLENLQKKALRNQALLDSALQGIRSVANRMSTLHRIRQTLDTYDETGQRRSIDAQPNRKMEKRA